MYRLLVPILIVACTGPMPTKPTLQTATLTPVPSQTPEPTATRLPPSPTATETPIPTLTFTPTSTRTPTPTFTPTPSIGAEVIRKENVAQVTQLSSWVSGGASRIVMSPDGKVVAWGANRRLELRQLSTGKTLYALGNGYWNTPMSFSANGNLLAAHTGIVATVWNVSTGQVVQTITTDGIDFVALSPDGQWIVFVSTPQPDLRSSSNLYRMRPDGSQRSPIRVSGTIDSMPHWGGRPNRTSSVQ